MVELLLALFLFSNLNAMDEYDDDDLDTDSISIHKEKADDDDNFIIALNDYYHQDTKSLDLSNIPLENHLDDSLISEIEGLIKVTGAEKLIMENNGLTEIPFELITFALSNKTLKYVSFKNNKFIIPNGSPETAIDLSKVKFADKDKKHKLSSVVASLWKSLSPELEKAVDSQNEKMKDQGIQLCKKVIFIDKKISPIMIINQDVVKDVIEGKTVDKGLKASSSSDSSTKSAISDACKEIIYKILCAAGGAVATAIPTLITLLTASDTCDMDELNNMMQLCNVTGTN